MTLTWDPVTMRTGVASIDRQHKKMIRQVNRLIEAIEAGRGRKSLARMLASLSREVSTHFGHEERVMCAAKCPARGVNRVAHRCFLREYAQLVRTFERDGASPAFVKEMERLCCEWLGDHIREVDAKLVDCHMSRARQGGGTP